MGALKLSKVFCRVLGHKWCFDLVVLRDDVEHHREDICKRCGIARSVYGLTDVELLLTARLNRIL